MPQAAPYFICKRIQHSFIANIFSSDTKIDYQWDEATDSELADAQERSTLFLQRISALYSYLRPMLEPLIKAIQIQDLAQLSSHFREPVIKINVDQFQALDALKLDEFDKKILVQQMVSEARLYLQNSSLAINFRECFFIEKGKVPPAHYREGIDVGCETLKEYKKQTSKFSYQFVKALFNHTLVKRSPDKKNSALDVFILQHYATKNVPQTAADYCVDYKRALSELPYHNSALEALINSKTILQYYNPQSITLIFGPYTSVSDLGDILQLNNSHTELTIILHNSKYSAPEERQKVYEEALLLVEKTNCSNLLNIILLTSKDVQHNLHALAPTLIDPKDTFSPLATTEGYYLSAPKLFSLILGNRRQTDSRNYRTEFLKKHSQHYQSKNTAYIYRNQKADAYRKTKTLNRDALISNSTLSLIHQQQLGQVQQINQTQVFNQTQQINQEHQVRASIKNDYSQGYSYGWHPPLDFQSFCDALQKAARLKLDEETKENRSLKQIYLTRRYYESEGADHYLQEIADNEAFRMRVAAKFFGLAYIEDGDKPEIIQLPHTSINAVDKSYVYRLIERRQIYTMFTDGINPVQRHLISTYLPYPHTRVLDSDKVTIKPYNYISALYRHGMPSQLGLASPNYQTYLQYYLLLSEEDLANTPPDQREKLISYANNLLGLFKKARPYNLVSTLKQEKELLELIKFYFADKPAYLVILNTLFNLFEEHNDDNLRTIIQIIIKGHRKKLEHFFNFLLLVESRGALPYFYQIYFKYAKDIVSVDQLINSIEHTILSPDLTNYNNFVDFVKHTPQGSSAQDWPLFEKFCYHVLLFAAKNNHYSLAVYKRKELKQFWQQLSLKFLAYTNQNAEQSQELLKSLVTHLIAEEGLTLAPLNIPLTFFVVLEQLIDHAIYNNTLKEQLEEMKGLSFLWTDVPHAINFNQFLVVCDEMKLYGQEINRATKRYSISSPELVDVLKNHSPKNAFLKTATFRYLGQEPQRHELSFYRKLHKAIHEQEYDNKAFLKELLFGYYINNHTGMHYQSPFKEDVVSKEFILFIQDIPAIKEIKGTVINQAITEFFVEYNKIYNSRKKEYTTLLELWQENEQNPLVNDQNPAPKILLQKFSITELKTFLIRNTKTLNECLSFLSKDPELAYSLIKCWFDKDHKATFTKTSFTLLRLLYPKLTMAVFLQNLEQITQFIEAYKLLIHYGARGNIYVALEHLLRRHNKIELALEVIELLAKELGQNNTHRKRDLLGAKFLTELSNRPAVLKNMKEIKPLLSLILNHYLNSTTKNESAALLIHLGSQVQSLKEEAAPVLKLLLAYIGDPQVYLFFGENQKLNAQQLNHVSQLFKKIGDNNLAVHFLQLCLQKQEDLNFTIPVKLLRFVSQEQVKAIITLYTVINSPTQLVDYIKKLKKIPPNTLQKLVDLHKTYTLNKKDLLILVESPSIPEAISEFERVQNTKNFARFDYNKAELSKKISQIKIKKSSGEITALSDKQQEQMLQDYEQLLSYMMQKPVLREQDGQGKSKDFSIYQLGIEQCALLLERLNQFINQGKKVHEHKLMKLALCCETLYRTTQKFPRNTQILNLLISLRQPGHIIHEVQTGEGKSIIAALHAALLYDGKRSIDIVTENNHLAQEGLEKFKPFYTYLEIPYASEIIEAQSSYYSYAAPGVNYSTASNLALFRSRAALDRHKLTKEVDLLCDEIDATLTTLVQYRLASSDESRSNNTDSWALLYKTILDFVKEKELFNNNHCDAEEDVVNFINYFKLKNPKMDLIKFIDQVDKESLNVALDSALTALELEENVDYMVVCNSVNSYAAPIVKATKRPDARVNFSNSIQQLLHARLNNNQPPPRYSFPIAPVCITITVTSAKNFFDFYRLNGGRLIGLTGTAGTAIELQEFYQQQGLVAYNYPTFYDSKAVDLGLFTAMNSEDHLELIFKRIEKHKLTSPSQPILIITASPQDTLRLNDYLASKSSWNLQIYNGYDSTGFAESEIITKAGQANTITIANESLARGADITPAHPQGLLVINATTEVTASALRQIQGRAARNGKDGSFCSIINVESIAHAGMTAEEIGAAFLDHQQHLSVQAQEQRAKTRLLEEVRYHLVSNCLLEVQQQASTILKRQFGADYVLVDNEELIRTLNKFNEHAERHYAQLLEKHGSMNEVAAKEFITAGLNEYQNILNTWLPAKKFDHIALLEPLVPLEHLDNLQSLYSTEMAPLALLSKFASKIWMHQGHGKMQAHLAFADKVVRILEPYTKNKCSLKYALGDGFINEELGKLDDLVDGVTRVEKEVNEFVRLLTTIPVLGLLIPKDSITGFIKEYLTKTKQQIKEKKWDDLGLPDTGINTILEWVARLQYIKNLGNYATSIGYVVAGGPAAYLVRNYIMPTLISWLTGLFGKLFVGSESEYVQVILGLNNISSDLSNAFFALSKLTKPEDITVGIFLNNFAPLFKNKALINLLITYLKLSEKTHLIPYVELVPEFLEALEPYSSNKILELFTVATLIDVLHKACQFEQIKKYVEHTEFRLLLDKLYLLTPEFLQALRQLSFKELVNLVKVLAHPEFSNFVNQLPAKAKYTDLLNWLNSNALTGSPEVKEAVDKLMDYQLNGERIAENSKVGLQSLSKQFSLSEDKLASELGRQAPEYLNATSNAAPELPIIPWKTYLGIATTLISLIIYNIFFFSISILLTSCLVAGILLYPYIEEQVSSWFAPDVRSEPEVVSVEPIVVSAQNTASKQLSLHDELSIRKLSRKYGFFDGAVEKEEGFNSPSPQPAQLS